MQIQQEIRYAGAQTLSQPIPRAHPQHPHSLAQSAARSSASHPQCSGARAAGLLQAWLPCSTCRTQEGKVTSKAAKGRSANGKRKQQKASSEGHKARAKGKQQRAQGKSIRQAGNGKRQQHKASSERQKGTTEGAQRKAILPGKTMPLVVQCIVCACKATLLTNKCLQCWAKQKLRPILQPFAGLPCHCSLFFGLCFFCWSAFV